MMMCEQTPKILILLTDFPLPGHVPSRAHQRSTIVGVYHYMLYRYFNSAFHNVSNDLTPHSTLSPTVAPFFNATATGALDYSASRYHFYVFSQTSRRAPMARGQIYPDDCGYFC